MSKLIAILPALLTLAIVSARPEARTWYLNPSGTGDAPHIQAAIDSATTGDVILLASGVYSGEGNRDLDFHGKAVVVQSRNGDAAQCVIDCEGSAAAPHRGVHCHSQEGLGSQLRTVTIRNGWHEEGGGALCESASSPIFDLCVFESNAASYGGGLYCNGHSSPEVTNCVFTGNAAQHHGGGIYCNQYASPLIRGCTLAGNSATYGGAISCMLNAAPIITLDILAANDATYGGGLSSSFNASPRLTNCTVAENTAANGGGISCASSASIRLESTIVAFNATGGSVYCSQCASAYLKCCDFFQNAPVNVPSCIQTYFGTGQPNMTIDPRFCGAGGSGNFELRSDSPCLPGNHPRYLETCGLIGAHDLGCGTIAVEPATWGTIKSLYR